MIGGSKEDLIGKSLWKCFPEAINTQFTQLIIVHLTNRCP
jgi:hypothetical protein